jgi:hypothetical protein
MAICRRTLPTLLINRFAVVSTGWKTNSSAIPADPDMVSHARAIVNGCTHLRPILVLCWTPSCTPQPKIPWVATL